MLKLGLKTRVTNSGEKVRFADLEIEERGDFLQSLPVYVCFNSFIDNVICKLNYE